MSPLKTNKKTLKALNRVQIPKELVYSKNIRMEEPKNVPNRLKKTKFKKTTPVFAETSVKSGLLETDSLDFVHDGYVCFSNFGFFGNVRVESDRIRVFKKSDICACCGIQGQYFKKSLEPVNKDYSNISGHINLFAIDQNTDSEVLMTKDHIVPKSLGGKDELSNYQTCCTDCNRLKGSNDITLSELREKLLILDTEEIIKELCPTTKVVENYEILINKIKARIKE